MEPAGDEPLFAPGAMVDHFRVMRLLGRGANGEVYLARDVKLGRKMALKIVRGDILDSREAIDRFLFEARATAKLSHSNVVTVFAAGEFNGQPYVALEYLDGETLRQRMNTAHPSPKEALRIAAAVADALGEAHRNNILHRDLKPENVMIPQDGRPRVLDFGLARLIRRSTAFETGTEEQFSCDIELPDLQTKGIVGTPAYMAPEQWLMKECSEATDIWALGVMLYELLALRRPFIADSLPRLGAKVAGSERAPELPPVPDVAPSIRELLHQTLEKNPRLRPSATEVAEALRLAILAPHARPAIDEDKSPFRGLLPFRERHAYLFFGREAEIAIFLERFRDQPVLPVIGPSGAGKSSFVEAGIIPRLRDQGRWTVLRTRPGHRPFYALASRLLMQEAGSTAADSQSPRPSGAASESEVEREAPFNAEVPRREETEAVAAELLEAPALLSVHLRALAERESTNVLLFIDQLEELYTLVENARARAQFMRAICIAADDPLDPVRVIFTVRDDFIGRIADTEEAREVLSRVTVLRAPSERALEETLTRPAESVGYRYEDERLPVNMLAEVKGELAALPMLQFACQLLWDRRDREKRVLLRSVYEAIGGVAGALASHGDGVLESLSPAQLETAREILLRLVTTDDTRRTLPKDRVIEGLGPEAATVLRRLTDARILTARRAVASGDRDHGQPEMELTHESLIRTWGRLRRWTDESKDDLSFLAELVQASELWERRSRNESELWSGEALFEAKRKVERLSTKAPEAALRFVAEGVARERRRKWRTRWATGATFLAVCIAAASFYQQMQAAESRRREAELKTAESLVEGAKAAAAQGDAWEARAKLRASLEINDSMQARGLWARLVEDPMVWQKTLPVPARDLAFSPDGRALAVLWEDRFVHFFDTEAFTEREVPTFEDGGYPFRMAVSPSEQWLAFVEYGGARVVVRDLRSNALKNIGGHKEPVWRLAFSPDGRRLLSTSFDRTVRLWAVPSWAEERLLTDHAGKVYGAAFDGGGDLLATGGADGRIRIWKTASGELAEVIEGHREELRDVAFSPDAKTIAAGYGDGTVSLFDVASRAPAWERRASSARVESIAFHPSGRLLAAAGANKMVSLLDASSGDDLGTVTSYDGDAQKVAFSPRGDLLASVGQEGRNGVARVFRVGLDLPARPLRKASRCAAASPDGRWLASGHKSGVLVSDLETGEVKLALSAQGDGVDTLAYSPNGKRLAAGSRGEIRVFDMSGGGTLERVLVSSESTGSGASGAAFRSLTFSGDGERLLAVSPERSVSMWNVAEGSEEWRDELRPHHAWSGAELDGDTLAVWSGDTLRFLDLANYRELSRVKTGKKDEVIRAVAFIRGGPTIYVSTSKPGDFDFHVLDSARKKVERSASISGSGLAMEPGGGIWYCKEDGLHIRDLTTLKDSVASTRDKAFSLDAGPSLAFSPDGRRLITRSYWFGGMIRVWDPVSKKPIWRAPLMLHTPAELLTQRGWQRLDGTSVPPRGSKRAEHWRTEVEREARYATESADSRSLCIETFDEHVELWDIERDQRRFREQLPRVDALVALPDSCVALASGKVHLFAGSGIVRTFGENVSAIALDRSEILLASQRRVLTTTGSDATMLIENTPTDPSAIAANELFIGLGFEGGRAEVVRRDRSAPDQGATTILRGPTTSRVTRLAFGPRGTLIAGYLDGKVAVFLIESAGRLLDAELDGPPLHLLVDRTKLHLASEAGTYTSIDLAALTEDYCALMNDVWRRAPVVWDGGRIVKRAEPKVHACAVH